MCPPRIADGEKEEAVLVGAVAATLEGVEEEDVGKTKCADEVARRRLLTTSVTISFDITLVPTTTESTASITAFASTLDTSLASAVSSGEFSNQIADTARAQNNEQMVLVQATHVSVSVAVVSTSDDEEEDDDTKYSKSTTASSTSDASVFLLGTAVGICCALSSAVVMCNHMKSQRRQRLYTVPSSVELTDSHLECPFISPNPVPVIAHAIPACLDIESCSEVVRAETVNMSAHKSGVPAAATLVTTPPKAYGFPIANARLG